MISPSHGLLSHDRRDNSLNQLISDHHLSIVDERACENW